MNVFNKLVEKFKQKYELERKTRPFLAETAPAFARDFGGPGKHARIIISHRVHNKVERMAVGERNYEYYYVIKAVLDHFFNSDKRVSIEEKRFLDIGGCGSVLPALLCAFGGKVFNADVRDWPLRLRNYQHILGDFGGGALLEESFDVVTCISTIDHCGLGRYGDPLDKDGDFKVMKHIADVLRPDGIVILTAPYSKGRPAVAFNACRIYDENRLSALLRQSDLKPIDEAFFGCLNSTKSMELISEAETAFSDVGLPYGLICLTAKMII